MVRIIGLYMLLPPSIYSKKTRIVLTVGLFIALVTLSSMYVMTRTPLYESHAKIWVQAKVTADSLGGQTSFSPLTYYFNSPILTACEVLRSSLVFQEAQKIFKQEHPGIPEPSIGGMEGGFKVEPVKDADVINVYLKDSDAKRTKFTLEAILEAFKRLNSRQAAGSAVQSRIFLERQLAQVEKNYADSRTRLRDFQNQHKAVDLEMQTKGILDHAASIENEIQSAQVAIAEERARIGSLETELAQLNRSANGSLTSSALVTDELQKKLASEQLKLLELKARLRETHPRVLRLEQSVNSTSKLLQQVSPGMTVGATEDGVSGASVERTIREMLTKAKGNFNAATNKLQLLRSALVDEQSKLVNLPDQQRELAELTRAEKVAASALNDVEMRLASSEYAENVATETSNFKIIEEPSNVNEPAGGNSLRNMLISTVVVFVFCVAFFFVLGMLNPYVSEAREAAQILCWPVLAAVGKNRKTGCEKARVFVQNWLKDSNTIVLTSANDCDEKADLAVGLANSFAAAGSKVLLVDCDFSNPACHQRLNQPLAPGLSDVSADPAILAAACHTINNHFIFLSAGGLHKERQLPSARQLKDLLGQLAIWAEVIILNAPAADGSADCFALRDGDSGLVVVAGLSSTPRRAFKALAVQIRNSDIKNGGLVLTNADENALADTASVESAQEAAAPVSW